MDHDNDLRTAKRDPRNASAFGRSKLRFYFSPFVEQISPNLVRSLRAGETAVCNDILFRSKDIRDQVKFVRNSSQNLMFLGHQIFRGGPHKFLIHFKIRVTVEHVSKFGDDRPSDFGD